MTYIKKYLEHRGDKMIKFMKYEIKGSYKFILGLLAIVLIASSIIQVNIYSILKTSGLIQGGQGEIFQGFLIGLSVLVIFGAFLTTYFYIIGLFRKDLYEDRGYLTYTLPLTGNEIVGAKLFTAIVYNLVLSLVIFSFNLILASILFGSGWIEEVKYFLSLMDMGLISSLLFSGFIFIGISFILGTILVYFSISLSKVSVKNKKIGGLWFIIFLIINGLVSYLSLKISYIFPYYMDVVNFRISHLYDIFILPGFDEGFSQLLIYGSNYHGYINIAGLLFEILAIVGGFLATSYLIEKKINL